MLTAFLLIGLIGCDKEEETISDNWVDMEFLVAGKKYTLPNTFDAFNKNGWILDENDVIPPGQYTNEYYEMYNESFYDKTNQLYASILVDFENETDKDKNIKGCTIWWISFTRMPYKNVELQNCYEIKLAKGIKWGSTEADIIAAYGNVEDGDRHDIVEDGYVALIYKNTTNNVYAQMVFYILNDGGLFMVDFEKYPIE